MKTRTSHKKRLQRNCVSHLLTSQILENMARQKGIIKLKGTISDVTFYKTKDGSLAREKGGVDGDRIANDPAFVRTRENGAEFGSAASAGKLIRDAVRPMLMSAGDSKVVSRLTQVMTSIKNFDTQSARGQRTVGGAIANQSAKTLLKGFNFNINAVLGAVLCKPYTVNALTGDISINSLVPVNDISFPAGATHVSIAGVWARIDFSNRVADIQLTNVVNTPLDSQLNNVLLSPAGVPAGKGTDLFLLHVEFFQEVNKIQYTLKNGSYNALAIVEVQ